MCKGLTARVTVKVCLLKSCADLPGQCAHAGIMANNCIYCATQLSRSMSATMVCHCLFCYFQPISDEVVKDVVSGDIFLRAVPRHPHLQDLRQKLKALGRCANIDVDFAKPPLYQRFPAFTTSFANCPRSGLITCSLHDWNLGILKVGFFQK